MCAGRAWEAAELRLKSQADLHALWFLCLKERNMLLSERLYFRQVGQAAPEPERLWKVKKTMARIKVRHAIDLRPCTLMSIGYVKKQLMCCQGLYRGQHRRKFR